MVDISSIFNRLIDPQRGDLTPELAKHFLQQSFTEEEKSRCEFLSYKAQDGTLTADELRELDLFLAANALLTALKAKAKRSLDSRPTAA